MANYKGTQIHKFSGAGNDFVLLDGRGLGLKLDTATIVNLCKEYSTDGLMLLDNDVEADFSMDFFNPDGSGGMMCGNGGRCIVAFADMLGLRPASAEGQWLFRAPDGLHAAKILEKNSPAWTVRLKMIDVEKVELLPEGYFLNTGTPHLIKFVPSVETLDIEAEAKPLRWSSMFAPEGTNVNFVEKAGDAFRIRTFEKGVEGETLACGTGITAGAIAAYKANLCGTHVCLQCRRGDLLFVDFTPSGAGFKDIFLTGPAERCNL